MDLNRANLEFHIDELVLHGFAPGDQVTIGAAMQQELSRLFSVYGVPRSLGQDVAVPRLNGGTVAIGPGMRADAVGVQVAQSLYGGFGQVSSVSGSSHQGGLQS